VDCVANVRSTDVRSCIGAADSNGARWRRADGRSGSNLTDRHRAGRHLLAAALTNVKSFEAFTADNDPHGEHDFGAFELGGEKLFWKIDTYDRDEQHGAEDPSDAASTLRVLTVMLASEY
jgi:hypothetical protein